MRGEEKHDPSQVSPSPVCAVGDVTDFHSAFLFAERCVMYFAVCKFRETIKPVLCNAKLFSLASNPDLGRP